MEVWSENELDASMHLQEVGLKKLELVNHTTTIETNVRVNYNEQNFMTEYKCKFITKTRLEQFEDWLEKHPKLEDIYYFFKHDIYTARIKEWCYQIKYFFQRLFTGYDDMDSWGIGDAVFRYALPLVKKYRDNLIYEHDKNGNYALPYLSGEEENGYENMEDEEQYQYWIGILNKVVWSLEESTTYKEEPILKCEECDRLWEEAFKTNPHKVFDCTQNELHEKHSLRLDEYNERVQEGLGLFHRYVNRMGD